MELPNLGNYTYPEGEEAIVAMLLQNILVDDTTSRCTPDMFHNDFLRNIYKISHDYVVGTGRGKMDFPALLAILQQMKKDSKENIEYLNYLYGVNIRKFPVIDYIVETLQQFSARRRLIFTLYQSLGNAQNVNKDVNKIMINTEEALVDIERGAGKKLEIILPKDIIERRRIGLDERYHSKSVYTQWDDFDQHLNIGFAPTKMSVIGGRTAMGKSFLKTNLISNMCQAGIGVANICPEQGFDSEHDRIDAILTGIHLRSIIRLKEIPLGDRKFTMLKDNAKLISGWPYVCIPTRGITVAGVQSAIRRIKRAGIPLDIVFIDLFDRLDDVNVAENRAGTISVKLGQIERIAQEEHVHVCLLVQINRGPESRKDKRPNLSDLRDCGNYEQDADLVLLLYREGYYNKDIEDNILEVEIAKQRDGVSGLVYQFMITNKETLSIAPIGKRQVSQEE